MHNWKTNGEIKNSKYYLKEGKKGMKKKHKTDELDKQ